jgi:hypothetical protein
MPEGNAMRSTVCRTSVIALLLVLAASFGLQRAARASDAGAVLGGIIAGAIVYELLDDDNGYYGPSHYYYQSPGYYRPPVCRSYGYTYYDYAPPVVVYRYDTCRPRPYAYRHDGYYDGPRASYQARRAPSHAQRNVGPPPGYGRGGKYAPPRYFK